MDVELLRKGYKEGGMGKTVGQAANATIEYYLRMTEEKEISIEDDFEDLDYFDF